MPLKCMSKYINEPNTFASLVFQGKLHQSRSYMQNARLSGIKANLFEGKDVGGRQIQQQLCVRFLMQNSPHTMDIMCLIGAYEQVVFSSREKGIIKTLLW